MKFNKKEPKELGIYWAKFHPDDGPVLVKLTSYGVLLFGRLTRYSSYYDIYSWGDKVHVPD